MKIERDLMRLVPREDWGRFPHLLIWHGRRVCIARMPRCEACVLTDLCPLVACLSSNIRTRARSSWSPISTSARGPKYPAEAIAWIVERARSAHRPDRPRPRRGHRQADARTRADRRASDRRRARGADAGAAARGRARSRASPRRGRGDPAGRRERRRHHGRPGVPLVPPRRGAARAASRPASGRGRRADLEHAATTTIPFSRASATRLRRSSLRAATRTRPLRWSRATSSGRSRNVTSAGRTSSMRTASSLGSDR